MDPVLVTTKVTGTPAATVIEAGSIFRPSVSVTAIRFAAAEAAGAADARAVADVAGALGAPPDEQATARTAAGMRPRIRRRITSSHVDRSRACVARRPRPVVRYSQ